LVKTALANGASDLHLEPGLPPALRVRGSLRTIGEPLQGSLLLESARHLIGHDQWPRFLAQRSFDLSKTIQGARCRINVLHSARGVGFAIRLLASFQATIERLNLHPDLKKLVAQPHGLILLSGPTGCGKSSTLAALIQEINLTDSRHIVTIESPIEYTFRPRRSFIRQREVGRDTPGFEQALLDALREDPDVIMVGEMREPQTMRLTLNASETGHLVLATVHSSSCAEALQRVISAFPPEIQSSVAAQVADCLSAVISQKLRFRPDLNIRVPECEILIATHAIKNFIRNRDFFKIASAIETGAEHGMWSFQRYRSWLESRGNWSLPGQKEAEVPDEDTNLPSETTQPSSIPPMPASKPDLRSATPPQTPAPARTERIEIEPVESEFGRILKRPGEKE
jgi:twitching motility protein PilT